ncbi:signal peptidase II [Pedobacter gandavensis]|uniref:signal peptidase II n=1 Tax=Pedobacter gandavensis TaxID=2679963 RepID=UPI002930D0F4|nr:signal peptidase II [Pedobacter gandavensis]
MKKSKFSGLAGKVLILVIILLNVGCDQISKSIVRDHVAYYENIKLFSDYVTLTKVENSGAFLSMGDALHSGIKFVLLLLMPVAVLVLGVYFVMTRKDLSPVMVFGVCCVIGGGIGNLYDRILYGSVTDFLHIDFVVFQTGVFNAADMSIMGGMLLIIIDSFYKKKVGHNVPAQG